MNWRYPLIRLALNLQKSRAWDYYQEDLSLRFTSRDELLHLQGARFHSLLHEAIAHVPYYRSLLNHLDDLPSNTPISTELLQSIPFLTKDIIRNEGSRLHHQHADNFRSKLNTSGGSTGTPVEILQSREMIERNIGRKLFYNHIIGKLPGEPEVKLWGSERDIFKGSYGIQTSLLNYFFNRRLLNSFRLSEERMKQYVDQINAYKPKSIWTYVDSIYELSRFIDVNSLSVHSPRGIITTAGTLTEDIRELVERVFHTSVYNQYGSREVGDIACECTAQSGLHVFEQSHIVEIVDKNGSPVDEGETGEIVITLLTNFSMPLIRYKIGDTATWASTKHCLCGLPLKRLQSVSGRITNHFKNTNGDIIHGEYFTHLFYHLSWIKHFKVTQTAIDQVRIDIVLSSSPVHSDIERIKDQIRLVLGAECSIEIQYRESIPPSSSGKRLYTESHVH